MDDRIAVGRIGRPHGVAGDVSVIVLSDEPDVRFRPGAVFAAGEGSVTLERSRWHHGRLLVHFREISDRAAAEPLRGLTLTIPAAERGPAGDDAWWDGELEGLTAELSDGTPFGTLISIIHGPAQDLLVIERPAGEEVLVPFVRALVPVVDVPGGRVVLAPPDGLPGA